jgi:hypothetical protein
MTRRDLLAVALACATGAALNAQTGFSGKWEGETPAGKAILLDITAKGKQLTGTLNVDKVPSTIADGTVDDKTFSFKASVEGHDGITFSGRMAGENLELTPHGMGQTVTLKRAKPPAGRGSSAPGRGKVGTKKSSGM